MRETAAPGASVPSDHVTVVPDGVPPSEALTNVAVGGNVFVRTTPFDASVPVLLAPSVYVTSPPREAVSGAASVTPSTGAGGGGQGAVAHATPEFQVPPSPAHSQTTLPVAKS